MVLHVHYLRHSTNSKVWDLQNNFIENLIQKQILNTCQIISDVFSDFSASSHSPELQGLDTKIHDFAEQLNPNQR